MGFEFGNGGRDLTPVGNARSRPLEPIARRVARGRQDLRGLARNGVFGVDMGVWVLDYAYSRAVVLVGLGVRARMERFSRWRRGSRT